MYECFSSASIRQNGRYNFLFFLMIKNQNCSQDVTMTIRHCTGKRYETLDAMMKQKVAN